MRKILSTVLALSMVFAVLPLSAIAETAKTEVAETKQLINADATIGLDKQLNGKGNTSNFAKVSGERNTVTGIDFEYSAEDLAAMSSEELVANTKDSLPNITDSERLALRGESDVQLKDPATSDNETIRKIAANKAQSKQKMQESIAYGEKLAAKKADEKYVVIDSVILITNEDELKGISGQDGYFRLACNINLTSPWEPIDFYGTLEGAGYTISAATMQYYDYDYVGFFSLLGENAVVRNLTLSYPYVYANSQSGALCAQNQGVIDNCHVENGTVVSYMWADFEYAFWQMSGYYMGGLVGINEGYIMNSSYTGDVDGWTGCGAICGANAGFVFACYANGNVCYETNTWDYDQYGAEYMYYYGYEYYPPFTTMLRMQWAAYMLLNYDATAFGFNGGLVGENYYAIFDSCVQGAGEGLNYTVGVVAGLDCVGGLVGGDVGWVSHCYSIDRAFPVPSDRAIIYCPWDDGDAGNGIYYDYSYFLIHKGIAYNGSEETSEDDEIFFYGVQGLPCADGAYHGTELTADQFYATSTFSNWNHGEWNDGEVWIITEGYIPIISDIVIMPSEYVICYKVGNSGGMLDGSYMTYGLAHYDEATGTYKEPTPPSATNTATGIGIASWTPSQPAAGKIATQDMTYVAFFGPVSETPGDGDDNPGPGPGPRPPIGDPVNPGNPDANLIGDANLDGQINTGDAVYVLRAVAFETVNTFTDTQMLNADTNFNSVIDTGDATAILKFCAGYISSFK